MDTGYFMFEFPDELDKALTQPEKRYVRNSKAMASTVVDVKETPNSYEYIVDMPGVKNDGIKVLLENDNVLKVSGVKKKDEDTENVEYLKIERKGGKYLRRFTLAEDADKEKISAAYKDGVLTITIPKVPTREEAKPRTIEVKVA
ncbi:hypothetical protein R1sor_024292 [Riccia sorocarpa]|uniref:SHSP domain-containing protein n=1 Tax=Riccia sorocarpa TaxID=122646 RepID=A0ABD3GRP4_9MARC